MSAKLVTLGGLSLKGAAFVRPKPLLLLTYLALEGPRDRYHLAELFWQDSANPLNSLAAALKQLKQGAPGVVEVSKRQVRSTVACDARAFLGAFEGGRYEEALALYQGPFLNGVYLPGWGVELEEWVYGTREFFGGRVREVFLRLGEEAAAKGEFGDAAGRARAAYRLRGAAELEASEIERLYTLLSAADHPQAKELRQEGQGYGLTLTLSPEEARASLRTEPEGQSSAPPHNLPLRATSFIGRELERAELGTLLQEDRLISLVGLAGVGKSRLALQVACEVLEGRSFAGGVYFVPLEALTSPEFIPASIAEGLSLSLQGSEDPLIQVVRHIGTKHMLLVLDNYEHLLAAEPREMGPREMGPREMGLGAMDGAVLAAELLKGCPNLKLLVTSRERLNLEEEVVVSLDGLLYPEAPVSSSEVDRRVNWEDFDALKLFVERARRARPGFALDQEDQQCVIAVCRLVEGAPLGIELASAWVRLMSCAEIAQEIEKNLDFLTVSTRNVVERHKSIRAAFEHSWQLLTPKEQDVLRKLSVFRGGFKREAAAEVAGATIPMLATLVDKSLLQVGTNGRYDRHPLLYQYTQEKLAEQPLEKVAAQAGHGTYYFHFLQHWGVGLRGAQQKPALLAIEEELENIRAAWSWAVAELRVQELQGAVEGLRSFFEKRGRLREGMEIFAQAAVALREHDHQAVLGEVLTAQAWFCCQLGRYVQATQLTEAGLALLRGEAGGIISGLRTLGYSARSKGNYPQAKGYFSEALSLAKEQQNQVYIASCLGDLTAVEQLSGNYEMAVAHAREALALYQALGDDSGISWGFGYLGFINLRLGKLDEAQGLLEEALQLARDSGEQLWAPLFTVHLGLVAYERDDYSRARDYLLEALKMVEETGEQGLKAWLLADIGRIETMLDRRQAKDYLLQSLALALLLRWPAPALAALINLAELQVKEGQLEGALELSSLVLHHSATEEARKEQAQRLQSEVREQVSPKLLYEALERGKARVLEEVIEEILRQPSL